MGGQPCCSLGLRARLWLRADWLGQRDGQALLWVHLDDRRVLAFRLPAGAFENDKLLGELIAQVADDPRGTVLEARLEDSFAIPLYAAPAAALPALPWGDPRHRAARAFAAGLDQEVLELLASLNRHRSWDSLRNYNRLAPLAPELRERRLQALRRFPLLTAPVLLSAHHHLDFSGGKRYAWRDHDDTVIDAIDRGRDLSGALARHYGISKGLVRAPICMTMWGSTALAHRRLLRLLDGIPAHRRPQTPADFEPAMPLFIALNLLVDDATDLRRLGQTAFREGLDAVCAPLIARYVDLGPALADCRDFLRAAADRATQIHPCPRGLTERRLHLAWIETRGFRSLLAASQRWHVRDWEAPFVDRRDRTHLAAIVGEHREGDARGRELCEAAELVREGESMHHCVAHYWHACRDQGTRIFALAIGAERATAEYRFLLSEARFALAQLRGPYNGEASRPMAAFARSVETALNALERAPARAELALSLEVRRPDRRSGGHLARPLDPTSERELAAVLAHLRPTLADGELLRDFVAGYQYHAGLGLEANMGVGDELALVREPENPHDHLAVAVCWRGERIGYLPRRVNADIARRLDGGERLVCRIARLDENANAWERVELVIRQGEPP